MLVSSRFLRPIILTRKM